MGQQQFRNLLASRKVRVLAALSLLIGAAAVLHGSGALRGALPEVGILVVDLRHGLPDKAEAAPDGRRSVSAVTVLRALDAARSDGRIAGVYLRLGGGGTTSAQASEIADAVLRLRRARKFAVAYAHGFTALNLSDRVLAAAADEVWTRSAPPPANAGFGKNLIPGPHGQTAPRLASPQLALWQGLRQQAFERIRNSAPRGGETAGSSVNVPTQTAELSPTQYHQGREARAERSALAWGGADTQFVALPTYRDALELQAANASMIALVQTDGVLDILEGPGVRDLAGTLTAQVRAAAADPRVTGIIIRLAAPAASGEALTMVFRAARDARRTGTPTGISFGPVIPARAATMSAGVPMLAPEGALLIDLAPGARAAELAGRLHVPWRSPNGAGATRLPAEALLLQGSAVVGAVGAGGAPGASGDSVPREGVNPVPERPEAATTVPRRDAVVWKNEVGSLLDLRDRLAAERTGETPDTPLIVPYEKKPSVWSRTKARFVQLWRGLAGLMTGTSE